MLAEPFLADPAVVALDISVLLRLAVLDIAEPDPVPLGPDDQGCAYVFRTVVHPNGAGFAAPFDNPIKGPRRAQGRQRQINFNSQTLAVEVVRDIQRSGGSPIAELVCHEIHRPGFIRPRRHGQGLGLVPRQAFAGLDPQVQFQFAIDLVDLLVVLA